MADYNQDDTSGNKKEGLDKFISDNLTTALNKDSGDLSDLRECNFNDYYGFIETGIPTLDEEQPYVENDYVSREVFEAVEWGTAALMKVMAGPAAIVEFVAKDAKDAVSAKTEAALVNHYIWKENRGFLILHNWIKEALLYPNSYIKVWPEETEETTHRTVSGLLVDDVLRYGDNFKVEDTEIIADLETYSGTLTETATRTKIRIMNIPPERMELGRDTNNLDLDEAEFIGHRMYLREDEAFDLGLTEEEIENLATVENDNTEEINRDFYEDELSRYKNRYMVYDISCIYDGTRRRVLYSNGKVLRDELDDYIPFIAAAAIVIPQKHVGMSIAESVASIQKYSTTLKQKLLENIIKNVTKRHYMWEEALSAENKTIESYIDNRADLVLTAVPPQTAIIPEQTTPVAQEIVQATEHITRDLDMRTGISPNTTLNKESLEQKPSEDDPQPNESISQRLELMLSVFVEMSYTKLVTKVHDLIRLHINTPVSTQLRGQFVTIDPTLWQKRTDIQSNVGIGRTPAKERLAQLMIVLGLQKEAMDYNLAKPTHIHYTLSKMVEVANLGAVDLFFTDPSQPVMGPEGQMVPWQPPKPPPDPSLIIAEAQSIVLRAEAKYKEMKGQIEAAESQLKEAELSMQVSETQSTNSMNNAKITEMIQTLENTRAELTKQMEVMQSVVSLNQAKTREIHHGINNPEPTAGDS